MSTQTSESLAETRVANNPFPGLRPFEFDESHLFFGRDGQSEQLIGKLSRTHFLAVVGTSGSGKSSLVRAGFLPALWGGFMTSAGSAWRVAILRPGNDPIGNLARALNAPDVFGSELEENSAIQTAIAESTLRRGSLGLVDTLRQAVMVEGENLLIVVDQFEEIFRFARVAEGEQYGNDAAAFIKLLLEGARQREVPIYVVLTMRSDYLGDCSQFWGLPEAINESQYLIPRLTRDQLREAISGPVAVGGGKITPRLVNRLLNEVGDNQDQLPVLQHLLMRSWHEWKEKRLEIEVKEGEQVVRRRHKDVHEGEAIDLCCADAVGGMAEALSRHADEAYFELPSDHHRQVAANLFKALTEKGTDNREIRRPITLAEISAVTVAGKPEVITVIETFRRPGRSFLMPQVPVALNSESLVDISHESLIRGWARLKDWVEDEARSSRIYRRLAETAELHREGKAGLWGDPDLQLALDWHEKNKPNKNWAQRYYPHFDTAMAFLQASEKKRDDDTADRERQQQAEIERAKRDLEQAQALAEAQEQRAEAQRQKAEEQQQRLEQQARATSRLRRLIGALVIVVLLAFATAVFALTAYKRAEVAGRVATYQTEVAVREKVKAVAAAEEADRQKQIALVAGGEAQNQKSNAIKEKENAEKAARLADTQKRIALAASKEANNQKLIAVSQKGIAVLAAGEAEKQKKIAEKEKGEADQAKLVAEDRTRYVLAQQTGFQANMVRGTGKDLERSVLLSVESLKRALTPEGYIAWEQGLDLLPHPADMEFAQSGTDVSTIAFSPDGRFFARGGPDGSVTLIQSNNNGTQLNLPPQTPGAAKSITFSNDGGWVAAVKPGHVDFWDTKTLKPTRTSSLDFGGESMALSPDGRYLAVAGPSGGNRVRVIDVTSSSPVIDTRLDQVNYVMSVAFSPNGKWLAIGLHSRGQSQILFWDVADLNKGTREAPKPVGTIVDEELLTRIVFSPKGSYVAAEDSPGVKMWSFSEETDQTLSFREVSLNKAIAAAGFPMGGSTVVFSADETYLATEPGDKTVRVWEISTGREMARIENNNNVQDLAFSPDGRLLATLADDLSFWKMEFGSAARRLSLHDGSENKLQTMTVSPGGEWLATGSSDGIRAFRTADWTPILIHAQAGNVSSFASDPAARWLIATSPQQVTAIDTKTWKALKVISFNDEKIAPDIGFSPDGRWLTVWIGNVLKIFEYGSWREVHTMNHSDPVGGVFFSPDSRWLAVRAVGRYQWPSHHGYDVRERMYVWDTNNGLPVACKTEKERYNQSESEGETEARKIPCPDVNSNQQSALLSEVADWKPVLKTDLPPTVSHDRRWSVIFGRTTNLILVDGKTSRGVATFGPGSGATSLAFTADDRWLLIADDKGITFWPLKPADMIDEACRRLRRRDLTLEEWTEYFSDEKLEPTCLQKK